MLMLILLSLPFFIGASGARISNETKKDVLNKSKKEVTSIFKGMKILYEAYKNESMPEPAVEKFNENLRKSGASKFMEEAGNLNMTFETIRGNGTYFVMTYMFSNGSLEDVYFGKLPNTGKNMQNIYIRINLGFIEKVIGKWGKATQNGDKEPGLGLIVSTMIRIIRGFLQGKIRIKPFWAILRIGRFLRFSSAVGISQNTTASPTG